MTKLEKLLGKAISLTCNTLDEFASDLVTLANRTFVLLQLFFLLLDIALIQLKYFVVLSYLKSYLLVLLITKRLIRATRIALG